MPKIKLFKDCLWRDGSHNINQAEVRARRNSNSIHGHLRREGSSSQARRTWNGAQLFNFLFQGFDWEGLDSRSLDPPITPKVFLINSCFWDIWLLSLFQVQGPSDTSNFDKYPRDEVVPGDEVSGWDKEFWRSETSASQPFPITKQPQTFWVCPNFHSSVEGPCFMKKRIFSTDILSPWLFSENQCLLYTWTDSWYISWQANVHTWSDRITSAAGCDSTELHEATIMPSSSKSRFNLKTAHRMCIVCLPWAVYAHKCVDTKKWSHKALQWKSRVDNQRPTFFLEMFLLIFFVKILNVYHLFTIQTSVLPDSNFSA